MEVTKWQHKEANASEEMLLFIFPKRKAHVTPQGHVGNPQVDQAEVVKGKHGLEPPLFSTGKATQGTAQDGLFESCRQALGCRGVSGGVRRNSGLAGKHQTRRWVGVWAYDWLESL